jgi:outer membrane protein TolC
LGAVADADQADTDLTTAQATLAALQADVTSAQATVSELSGRIISAGIELAELRTLAAANGTDGKLDAQVAKRTAVYDAYIEDGTNGDKGPR